MRFAEDNFQFTTELAGDGACDFAMDVAGKKLRCREFPFENVEVVEVLVSQRRQGVFQDRVRQPDVDDDIVLVDIGGLELCVHDIGGAMKFLRRPEHRARE